METRSSFRISAQLVLGLIVIFIGAIFTLDNLDILEARDYLRYWPALLVIFGLAKLFQARSVPGKFWGMILTLVGSVLLLDRLDIFYFRIWDYWPLIFVLLGTSLIWRSMARQRGASSADNHSTINAFTVMGGFRRANNSQDFQGGEITAIMGGCELDLRQASIKEGDAVLDLFAFWGGVEISVPDDWNVVMEGVPIMGGFEDKTQPAKTASNKRLVVKGYAIMGGVEIKN